MSFYLCIDLNVVCDLEGDALKRAIDALFSWTLDHQHKLILLSTYSHDEQHLLLNTFKQKCRQAGKINSPQIHYSAVYNTEQFQHTPVNDPTSVLSDDIRVFSAGGDNHGKTWPITLVDILKSGIDFTTDEVFFFTDRVDELLPEALSLGYTASHFNFMKESQLSLAMGLSPASIEASIEAYCTQAEILEVDLKDRRLRSDVTLVANSEKYYILAQSDAFSTTEDYNDNRALNAFVNSLQGDPSLVERIQSEATVIREREAKREETQQLSAAIQLLASSGETDILDQLTQVSSSNSRLTNSSFEALAASMVESNDDRAAGVRARAAFVRQKKQTLTRAINYLIEAKQTALLAKLGSFNASHDYSDDDTFAELFNDVEAQPLLTEQVIKLSNNLQNKQQTQTAHDALHYLLSIAEEGTSVLSDLLEEGVDYSNNENAEALLTKILGNPHKLQQVIDAAHTLQQRGDLKAAIKLVVTNPSEASTALDGLFSTEAGFYDDEENLANFVFLIENSRELVDKVLETAAAIRDQRVSHLTLCSYEQLPESFVQKITPKSLWKHKRTREALIRGLIDKHPELLLDVDTAMQPTLPEAIEPSDDKKTIVVQTDEEKHQQAMEARLMRLEALGSSSAEHDTNVPELEEQRDSMTDESSSNEDKASSDATTSDTERAKIARKNV